MIFFWLELKVILSLYTPNHNDFNPTVHMQMQMQIKKKHIQKQADSLLFKYELFINFWIRFFNTRRETQFLKVFRNHTILTILSAVPFVMSKISVDRDPKIPTTSSTIQNSILYAPMAENSSICLHGRNSTICLQGPMSTLNFLFFKILKFSAHLFWAGRHPRPSPFPVWCLSWQWWSSYLLRTSIKPYLTTVHLN